MGIGSAPHHERPRAPGRRPTGRGFGPVDRPGERGHRPVRGRRRVRRPYSAETILDEFTLPAMVFEDGRLREVEAGSGVIDGPSPSRSARSRRCTRCTRSRPPFPGRSPGSATCVGGSRCRDRSTRGSSSSCAGPRVAGPRHDLERSGRPARGARRGPEPSLGRRRRAVGSRGDRRPGRGQLGRRRPTYRSLASFEPSRGAVGGGVRDGDPDRDDGALAGPGPRALRRPPAGDGVDAPGSSRTSSARASGSRASCSPDTAWFPGPYPGCRWAPSRRSCSPRARSSRWSRSCSPTDGDVHSNRASVVGDPGRVDRAVDGVRARRGVRVPAAARVHVPVPPVRSDAKRRTETWGAGGPSPADRPPRPGYEPRTNRPSPRPPSRDATGSGRCQAR